MPYKLAYVKVEHWHRQCSTLRWSMFNIDTVNVVGAGMVGIYCHSFS